MQVDTASGGAAGGHGREGRAWALGALGSFLLLLIVSELFCRTLLGTGALYGLVDASGTLTSVAEVKARARAFAGRQAVGLLGDSVAGVTALVQHRVPRARQRSLTAELDRRLTPRGVLPLSADGLLLPDVEGLLETLEAPPRDVILLLNFRMFARSWETEASAGSRDGLLPVAMAGPREAPSAAAAKGRLDARLYESAAGASSLFLVTQVLRARLFVPTRKDAIERGLARLLPAAEDDDLAASVLRLRIAPIYEDRDWNPASPAFSSLGRILARRRSAGRTLVALVPQNPSETAAIAPERLQSNRDLLKRTVVNALGADSAWIDLSDAMPQDAFLDHCHLTGEGNARLAGTLAAAFVQPGRAAP